MVGGYRSLSVVHTLSAHAGPVTALDIKEHLLVTCGMNIFRGQVEAEARRSTCTDED